jgi:flagellar basal body-associated protein FliL
MVEEPAAGASAEAAKPESAAKPVAEGEDAAKKKKKNKKLVAIVVGVLAVVVLAVVGVAVMGGGKKPPAGGGAVAKGGGGGGGGGGSGGLKGGNTNTDTANPNANSGDTKEDIGKKDTPKVTPKTTLPFSEKETTNLFPGQVVSLYRFDIDKIHQTPLPLFDSVTMEMFRESFGFDAEGVAVYYHTFVGNSRDPFGVIRTKEPVSEKDILSRMALANGTKTVKGRDLYAFKSNPFINAIANVCSFNSLFAELYAGVPISAVSTPAARIIGVCVYDTQHILVGDYSLLNSYMEKLDNKGYPEFQSMVNPPPDSKIAFAEKPLYLSISPKLKSHLKELGSESSDPPAVIYGEKLVQGLFDLKPLKFEYLAIAAMLDPILKRTVYLGANLLTFTTKQATATIRLEMSSQPDALEVVRAQLEPGLRLASHGLTLLLESPVAFKDRTPGAAGGPSQVGPNPGPGVGPGPGSGPLRPPGLSGSAGGPPGMGSAGGPPGRPGGSSGGPPPGMGSAGGPPGSMRPPGSPNFPPPIGNLPGQGGAPEHPTPSGPASEIDLGLTDAVITIKINMHWTDDAYRQIIAPQMFRFANILKGKMAVYASDTSFHNLALAVPKMTAETKMFPRGTADRPITDSSRKGLRYPPQTRVSFFAELLPYLGRGNLSGQIDRQLAWFDEKNLPAAEAWVPELLVPFYPQMAWRATSPYVHDGRILGGTNYVAIAGIGDDAARYNPANPADAKKVGIIGYEWGSKVEEVTDGLSNTIFLMQTPPAISQPWMAGGGATIRGLNDKDPMHGFRHNFNPNGQVGTYALMGDGSVRFLKGNINPEVLKAMATRAGGDNMPDLFEKEAPRVDQPKKLEGELKTDPKAAEPTPPVKSAEPKKSSDSPVSPMKDSLPGPKLEQAPQPREKT